MNVSLQGARSKARLDWDSIEHDSERARQLPRRIFVVVLLAFAAYIGWGYFSG